MSTDEYTLATVLRGARPGYVLRPSKRWEPGRRCEDPGCATLLSIYNTDDRCALHQPAPNQARA